VRAWLSRLLGLTRRHADEALRQEIDTHLALQAEEFERRGMSQRDARDAALRAFGGVEKTKTGRSRSLPRSTVPARSPARSASRQYSVAKIRSVSPSFSMTMVVSARVTSPL